jgi:putative DNA primase/helicase
MSADPLEDLDPDTLEREANARPRGKGGESGERVEKPRGSVPAAPEVSIISAADVRPEPVSWLWEGWLARGKIHILAGAPGTGKTTLALAIGAILTVGSRWPDGTRADCGDVLIWSGEDDARDTLVPRLIACGANLERLHFVGSVAGKEGSRPFDPATDAVLLADRLAEMNPTPALLLVDPIVSAVAGDSHKNAEVRRALQPLVDLAQARRCAVLGISHFTKGTAQRDPVERVTGSLAFGALPRVVLAAAKLPQEEGGGRILARGKSNLGPDDGGLAYQLEPLELPGHPGVSTIRVLWGEPLQGTARELLAKAEVQADPEEQGALADAKAFLSMLLADGPVPAREVQSECERAGHRWATIRRARKDLGVEAGKEGGRFGNGKQRWTWRLPQPVPHGAEFAQQKNMSTMSTFCGNPVSERLPQPPEGAQSTSTLCTCEQPSKNKGSEPARPEGAQDAQENDTSTFKHLEAGGDTDGWEEF